ncbi:hypothetical protein ES703_66168 [subsurface metagenome]
MEYFCIKERSGSWVIGWFTSYKYIWQLVSTHETEQEALQEIRSLNQEDLENEKQRR